MRRGVALCVAILLATAANQVSRAAGAAIPGARLTAITSKADGGSASLVIEATEPLPYVATRPDPLTVVIDFRNVSAQGAAAPAVTGSAGGTIASVAVEAAESMGVPVSRVRIALAQPVAHHVRADRHRVVIDFDRAEARSIPYVAPPVSRQATQPIVETRVDPIAALGLAVGTERRSAAPVAAQATTAAAVPVSLPTAPTAPTSAPAAIAVPGSQASLAAGAQSALAAPAVPAPALQAQAAQAPQAPDGTSPSRSGRVYSGNPVSLDFQQADLRAVLRVFSEISGLNIVIDPAGPRHRRCRASRRAVGPGARHHPARQQAGLHRRRHRRADRAADSARRRGEPAPQAGRRAGAGGRPACPDADPELRACRGTAGAAHEERAVPARHRSGRSPHQHDHHHRPGRPPHHGVRTSSTRSTRRSRRWKSRRESSRPRRRSRGRSASSGAPAAASIPPWATRRTWRSRTAAASPDGPAARRAPTAPPRRSIWRRRRDQRGRPGARLGERRLQPRRGAERARDDPATDASCRRRACRR